MQYRNYDLYVAIEAGVGFIEQLNKAYIFTWVAASEGEEVFYGRSLSYSLPDTVWAKLNQGIDLAQIAEQLSNIEDIRSKGGFVSFISKNVLSRVTLTRDAVICALLPIVSKRIYNS